MAQFKVGDWVIITHRKDVPLCVLGRVLGLVTTGDIGNGEGILVDTIWRYDPKGIDTHKPGEWPVNYGNIRIERCGPPDGAV